MLLPWLTLRLGLRLGLNAGNTTLSPCRVIAVARRIGSTLSPLGQQTVKGIRGGGVLQVVGEVAAAGRRRGIGSGREAVNVGVREALLLEQLSQPLVLLEHFSRGCLDLGRGFDADCLAGAVLGLQLLQVLLATSARTALVVANAREVCFLGLKRRLSQYCS